MKRSKKGNTGAHTKASSRSLSSTPRFCLPASHTPQPHYPLRPPCAALPPAAPHARTCALSTRPARGRGAAGASSASKLRRLPGVLEDTSSLPVPAPIHPRAHYACQRCYGDLTTKTEGSPCSCWRAAPSPSPRWAAGSGLCISAVDERGYATRCSIK